MLVMLLCFCCGTSYAHADVGISKSTQTVIASPFEKEKDSPRITWVSRTIRVVRGLFGVFDLPSPRKKSVPSQE